MKFGLIILLFPLALGALAKDDYQYKNKKNNKVIVEALKGGEQIEHYVPEFTTEQALISYSEQNLAHNPNTVLQAFAKFQKQQISENLTGVFYLGLADVYQSLNKQQALKNLLGYLARIELTKQQQLELLIFKANAELDQLRAFEANNLLAKAYMLASELDDNKLRSEIAVQQFVLFTRLKLKDQANDWLDLAYKHNQNLPMGTQFEFLYNLAERMVALGAYIDAIANGERLLALAKANGLGSLLPSLELNQANLLLISEQPKQAIAYLEPIFNQAQKQRNFVLQYQSLVATMQAYLMSGSGKSVNDVRKLLPIVERLSRYENDTKSKQRLIFVKALFFAKSASYYKANSWYDKLVVEQLEPLKHLAITRNKMLMLRINWLMHSGEVKQAQQQITEIQADELKYQLNQQRLIKHYFSAELKQQHLSQQQQQQNHQQLITELTEQHQAESDLLQLKNNWLNAFVIMLIAVGSYLAYLRMYRTSPSNHLDESIFNHPQLVDRFKNKPLEQQQVILFDIDNVRALNSRFGHNYVDSVLAACLKLVIARTGNEHDIYQLSGDRFLLWTKKFTQYQSLLLAELLRKELNTGTELRSQFDYQWLPELTASFVVTEIKSDESLDALKDRLVSELQQIKQSGGNVTSLLDH